MERARVAAGNLANAQARLQALNGQMAASTGAMATATQRFRAAQTAAAAASVSFATRLRGLIAAINPFGIAVSLAITGLILLAMRKDAAAREIGRAHV